MIYFLLITIQLTRLNGDGLFDDVTPLHLPHLAHLSWRMKQYFIFFSALLNKEMMNLLAAIEAEPERHSPELTAEICIHKQKKKFVFFLKREN